MVTSRDYFRNRLGGGVSMKKKVLTLTVSKQWFDMIVADEKTEEYREINPYWVARLFQNNSNIVGNKFYKEK